jgi:hypothetical protein
MDVQATSTCGKPQHPRSGTRTTKFVMTLPMVSLSVRRHPRGAPRLPSVGAMCDSSGCNQNGSECAVMWKGWSHRFRPRPKGPLGLTEKNFQWEKYFSLAVFWGDRLSQLRHAQGTDTNNHGLHPRLFR